MEPRGVVSSVSWPAATVWMLLGDEWCVTRGEYAPGPGLIVASWRPPSRGCVPNPNRGEETLSELTCLSVVEDGKL